MRTPTGLVLHFRLFSDLWRIVNFNPEIAHGALQLGVSKKKLDGPQVFGAPIDQCRFRPPHSVRAIHLRIEPDRLSPAYYYARVLAS